MASSSTILGEQHLKQINDSLASLDRASKELAMAKRAGLTVGANGESIDALTTKVENAQAKLRQIKNVYFPGQ